MHIEFKEIRNKSKFMNAGKDMGQVRYKEIRIKLVLYPNKTDLVRCHLHRERRLQQHTPGMTDDPQQALHPVNTGEVNFP